ncbi:MAG: hypothetical protein NPIRA04_20990 [Nitrospirales bacterium]|nr:MAG: hypothetical protein NPIRA04_20990 [Nitrospirales bacterium]
MEDKLRQVVAELFETDLNTVTESFLLSTRRMQGSLARAKLDAAIRNRLGVKSRAVYSAKTYGELKGAVLGVSSSSDESDSVISAISSSDSTATMVENSMGGMPALTCGIDVEMVENLPEVDDYWQDSFYTNSFSSVEIAYCLLQENPRMHFAARWCAKEALKKCDPSYLSEEMKNLEVLSHNGNPPIFRHYQNGTPTPIPFAVSLSHTPVMAVAMTIKQVN